ncbi:MAG TPA: hypothetical protein VKP13_18165 [Nitrospira sp.]|nr:hypothetical protein [Nitrospira sp.]
MRILVIGATGTIGSAIVNALAARHDVVASGIGKFAGLDQRTYEDYFVGLTNKLMWQVNLVRLGLPFLNDDGSFTLTSGVLSREPMKRSASISMIKAGLEGFVRAADGAISRSHSSMWAFAFEIPRGQKGSTSARNPTLFDAAA